MVIIIMGQSITELVTDFKSSRAENIGLLTKNQLQQQSLSY
ncbi:MULTISPECIES: hypothetical protein [Vibrio]|nr:MULTISPECIES: hypothetical protein [Vibrio]